MDAPARVWSGPALRSWVVRVLILSHRWLGIALSLVVMMWFLSGIVMIYAGGMPRLAPQARLDHLPVLDLGAIRLGPAEAARALGLEPEWAGPPTAVTLLGRPAWRFGDAGAVFADDGTVPEPLGEREAARVASGFLRDPSLAPRFAGRIDSPDQWTLALRGAFPLLKFAAGDEAGTELYVSSLTGEVALATTRAQRALAWVGTIPHWLYFSSLRLNPPLWYRIVVTLSALATVLAVLGLALAFTQWRRRRPAGTSPIPYRGGMKWHYVTGAVFGAFALTWAFSGLLSMEPFAWTTVPEMRVDHAPLTGGEVDLAAVDASALAALAAQAAPRFVKEVSLTRIHGEHYWMLRTSAHQDARALPRERLHAPYDYPDRSEDSTVLVHAETGQRRDEPFTAAEILPRVVAAVSGANVLAADWLTDYDDYYYSRSRQQPLPVLRVKLDDPLGTWLYVDARTSRVVANVHRYSRIERWLYSGLHSLDFRFWYAKRPLWDLGMLVLLAGGLATSAIGFWFGVRRLVGDIRRC